MRAGNVLELHRAGFAAISAIAYGEDLDIERIWVEDALCRFKFTADRLAQAFLTPRELGFASGQDVVLGTPNPTLRICNAGMGIEDGPTVHGTPRAFCEGGSGMLSGSEKVPSLYHEG